MMRTLMLGSFFTGLAPFYSICRCRVRTISSRYTAHVASANLSIAFHRHLSFSRIITSSINSRQLTQVMPFRTLYLGTRNETNSRNVNSAHDNRKVKLDAEESRSGNWLSYTPDWSKHELLMMTCYGFWRHLPDGAHVIASYVDTAAAVHKAQRRQMRTALMVPSGMSDHIELKPLLDLMVKDGWRVVIPDVLGM